MSFATIPQGGSWGSIASLLNNNSAETTTQLSGKAESTVVDDELPNKNILLAVEEALTTVMVSQIENSAQLDGTGKLESSQIPDSLIAGLEWKGVINVTTDTLDTPATANNGNFYKVGVGGVSSITGTSTTFTVGDWIISNGTSWEHIESHVDSATTSTEGMVKLAGDLGGTSSSVTVTGIQGIPFSNVTPTDGQSPYYDADAGEINWESNSLTTSGVLSEDDWTWDSDTNTLIPTTKLSHSIGSSTYPLLATQVAYLNLYDVTGDYSGRVTGDYGGIGIFGTTNKPISIGYTLNDPDLSFESDGVNVNADLVLNTSSGAYSGRITGNYTGGVGLWGTTNKPVHIGYALNTPDLTFESDAIYADNSIVISNGNELRFEDGDPNGARESLQFRMDGNNLCLYGSVNEGEYSEQHIEFSYSGVTTFYKNIAFDTNDTINVGTTSSRAANLYTNDLYVYYPSSSNRARFYIESTGDLRIDAINGQNVYLENTNGTYIYMSGGGSWRPSTDDDSHLGSSSLRWDNVYATNTSINSSDERLKSFEDIPEALLDVWPDYVSPRAYKWYSSIAKKGEDEARIHMGVVAQDIIKAFLAASLDWTKYGVVCACFEDDELDNPIVPEDFDYEDIDNLPDLMIRYDHVMVIEMAVQRRRIEKLEQMLG